MPAPIRKIVSGGQTGVDRAGLDFAIARGLGHGGWCPKGRRAEDGAIPERYGLRECASAAYKTRTRLNVADSDGTLVLLRGRPKGGTLLTVRLCRELGKALFVIDLDRGMDGVSENFCEWVRGNGIEVLNVAGPRQTGTEYDDAMAALGAVIPGPAANNGGCDKKRENFMDKPKVEC